MSILNSRTNRDELDLGILVLDQTTLQTGMDGIDTRSYIQGTLVTLLRNTKELRVELWIPSGIPTHQYYPVQHTHREAW